MDFMFWDELSSDDQKVVPPFRSRLKQVRPLGSTTDACRYYVHQRSVRRLKRFAELGCHLCSLLWYSLFELPADYYNAEHFGIDWRQYRDEALVFTIELYREGPWVEQLGSEYSTGSLWVRCADLEPLILDLRTSSSGTYRQPCRP